jgi:hypothetical protein
MPVKSCKTCGASIPPKTPHTEFQTRVYRWCEGYVPVWTYQCQACASARKAKWA